MDQSQSASLIGGRYELIAEHEHGSVEVLDHEPWRCCWSCGSTENEVGEAFCTNCGADLRNRRYRGVLTSAESGLALVSKVKDERARVILPDIWDQVEEGDRSLIILKPPHATPVSLPVSELVALRIGLAISQVMVVLHNQHIELGELELSDIGLTASGQPKILHVEADNLCRITASRIQTALKEDLRSFASLLEELTNTPRMTQRLEEANAQNQNLPTSKDDSKMDLVLLLRDIRTGSVDKADVLVEQIDALIQERTHPIALEQSVGAASDTGKIRDHNEDSYMALQLSMSNKSVERTWGIYIVADGMGGHAAGEIASGLAISGVSEIVMSEYLSTSISSDGIYDEEWAQDVVRRSVHHANETIRQRGIDTNNDMGTTITMALVVGDRATIANIGDSRTYLYREGKLRRISKDHSLVMRLVDLGQINESDIYTHPQRNAVLRSLGDRLNIEVDIFTQRLLSGDVLLLCSDGQWEMTHDHAIEEILESFTNPEYACKELIRAANDAGGEDNITSVLVRFH